MNYNLGQKLLFFLALHKCLIDLRISKYDNNVSKKTNSTCNSNHFFKKDRFLSHYTWNKTTYMALDLKK